MELIALHREIFRIDSEEVKKMMKIIILESECLGGDFGKSLQKKFRVWVQEILFFFFVAIMCHVHSEEWL